MGSKKMRDLLTVLFVALFFMTREMVFIWLIVGTVVLFHPSNGKASCRGKLRRRIVSDANKYGLKVPKNKPLREKLNRVYRRYENSSRTNPQFQSHYDEIIDNLWLSLAADEDIETWNYLLKNVLNEWPEEKANAKKKLRDKLNEVNKLTTQWNEARHEAMGES